MRLASCYFSSVLSWSVLLIRLLPFPPLLFAFSLPLLACAWLCCQKAVRAVSLCGSALPRLLLGCYRLRACCVAVLLLVAYQRLVGFFRRVAFPFVRPLLWPLCCFCAVSLRSSPSRFCAQAWLCCPFAAVQSAPCWLLLSPCPFSLSGHWLPCVFVLVVRPLCSAHLWLGRSLALFVARLWLGAWLCCQKAVRAVSLCGSALPRLLLGCYRLRACRVAVLFILPYQRPVGFFVALSFFFFRSLASLRFCSCCPS